MDQIFCLAPPISPPMLPVVSRQNTTSTCGFLPAGTGAAAADPRKVPRLSSAAREDQKLQKRDMGGLQYRIVSGCSTLSSRRTMPGDRLGPGPPLAVSAAR